MWKQSRQAEEPNRSPATALLQGIGAALAATALTVAVAPPARAETIGSNQAAAQFLTLGASAAYAFQDSSSGSSLARITQAQTGGAAPPAPMIQLASAQAPAPTMTLASLDWSSPQPRLQPAVLTSPPRLFPRTTGRDPSVFGSVALAVGHSALDARWMRVENARTPADPRWTRLVRAAEELPDHARLAAVNSWWNHAIAFQSDQQNYGVSDYWASARESLARGRGDCEDYAIAKMETLQAAGIPASNLYLVVAKDLVRHADHALLLVRLDDGFWVLDSGGDEVLPAESVADYRPVVTFSAGREWMHGYRRAPDLMLASATRLAPASGR